MLQTAILSSLCGFILGVLGTTILPWPWWAVIPLVVLAGVGNFLLWQAFTS